MSYSDSYSSKINLYDTIENDTDYDANYVQPVSASPPSNQTIPQTSSQNQRFERWKSESFNNAFLSRPFNNQDTHCLTISSSCSRTECLKKLIDTEINYVSVLERIIRIFVQPLSNIIKKEEILRIFDLLGHFYSIHVQFKNELCKAADNLRIVSNCFIFYQKRFLKYKDYCMCLSKAVKELDEISNKNDCVSHQLIKCQLEADEGISFKLKDLIFLPPQRIMSYHLMLGKLIRSTTLKPEEQEIKKAREVMADLARYINEVKKDSDALQIIDEISSSITCLPFPSSRTQWNEFGRFIVDGKVKMKSFDDGSKAKRYMFVFDRAIIICKDLRRKQYRYKDLLLLEDYELNTSLRNDLKEKWGYHFKLTCLRDDHGQIFYAKNLEEREKWTSSIQKAFSNIRPLAHRSYSHEYTLSTFDNDHCCDHCDKLLFGLICQGYKCKVCSVSLHKECLDQYNAKCSQYVVPQRYSWFLGSMGREKAQELLRDKPPGTFLVRESSKQGNYVISLNYNCQVKHMKINTTSDGKLYLSENRYFGSLSELVSWYQNNSLDENFHLLNSKLSTPINSVHNDEYTSLI